MRYFILLTALTVAGMANAQSKEDKREQKSPEEKAAMMTKKMTENLGLSPQQIAKIEPENRAFFQEQEALHEQMKSLRDQQKKLAEKHQEKIKSVLTPEQQKKAEKTMERRKEKRRRRMERRMRD